MLGFLTTHKLLEAEYYSDYYCTRNSSGLPWSEICCQGLHKLSYDVYKSKSLSIISTSQLRKSKSSLNVWKYVLLRWTQQIPLLRRRSSLGFCVLLKLISTYDTDQLFLRFCWVTFLAELYSWILSNNKTVLSNSHYQFTQFGLAASCNFCSQYNCHYTIDNRSKSH